MKKNLCLILLLMAGVVSLCGSAQAFFLYPGVPQEVEVETSPMGGPPFATGTISFAGGDSPLMGDFTFNAVVFYWANRFGTQGYVVDYFIVEGLYTIRFETGVRVGSGYDFSGGGFLYGPVGGVFEEVHVNEGGGLVASFRSTGAAPSGPLPPVFYAAYGPGILTIGFAIPEGVAPGGPFTSTNIGLVFMDAVPLPASALLLGSGLLGLVGLRWRKMRQA